MKNVILFSFLLILLACSSVDNNQLTLYHTDKTVHIEVDQNFFNKITHPDSIFSAINFLPLETTEDCLIKDVKHFQIKDSLIFINDDWRRLLVFDQKGKFIRQIGQIGQGPGEYTETRDFYIGDSLIIVLDFQKLDYFSLKGGEYLYSTRFDLLNTDLSCNVKHFYPAPSGGYYFWGGTLNIKDFNPKNNRYLMYKVNEDMNIEDSFFLIQHGAGSNFYKYVNYKDTILLDPSFASYNVYQFDNHGVLSSRYYYDFGKYTYVEKLPTKRQMRDRENTYEGYIVKMYNFLETDRLTHLTFSANQKAYSLFYSKLTEKQYFLTAAKDRGTNEMRFWTAKLAYQNSIVMPIEISWIKGEMDTMSQEYIQKLGIENFADMDEANNPVLIFYEFRNDI